MFQRNTTRHLNHTLASTSEYDEGLRRYMLSVYNYLGLGLALAGGLAMLVASTPALYGTLLFSPLRWVIFLAPLGLLFYMSARFESIALGTMKILYWVFASVLGISLASILLRYTGESVARTFFITAAAFGGLSLWGYTTKRSLSGIGTFCVMGLIGLVIASIVNIFLGSSMMQFIIAVAGVLIFSGLIAYDTQKIKNQYFQISGSELQDKVAVMGAVSLFLNFINLFQFLLMFLGNRE